MKASKKVVSVQRFERETLNTFAWHDTVFVIVCVNRQASGAAESTEVRECELG